MEYISTIAVDLGGKNTGVLLAHGKEDDLPENQDRLGWVVTYPESGLKLSLKDRLANRHHRRTLKRKKLAKRLLALILQKYYKGKDFHKDFNQLRTFLNRRGYTYLTLEELQDAETTLKECPTSFSEVLYEITKGKIKQGFSLWSQLLKKTEQKDNDFYSEILKDLQEIKKSDELKTLAEKYEINVRELKQVLSELERYGSNILKAELSGHKHRRQYIEEIRLDLKSAIYSDLVKKFQLKEDELANLIGHVANLQLRVLRKYFNNKEFSKKDFWDEARFKKIFIKYLRSWRSAEPIYKKNRQFLIQEVEKRGVLETFKATSPEYSIPPFEEQNNRRPPRCHSLHLDPKSLDKYYPKWKEWLEKILGVYRHRYELDDSASYVKEISEYYQKASTPHKKVKTKEAILLQRILDRNKALDVFQLRVLAKLKEWKKESEPPENLKRKYETGLKELKNILGKDADSFINLAQQYYTEVERAKRGIWLPDEEKNLLFVCLAKPKLKKNSQDVLIGAILGVKFKQGEFDQWKKFFKEEKLVIGKKEKTISKWCAYIEEERKKSPEEFYTLWNLHKKDYKANIGLKRKTDFSSEPEFLEILPIVSEISKKIQEHFKHNNSQKERYDNPYSITQIYNIMEGDLGGFHRTCPACTLENEWRSSDSAERPEGEVNQSFARAVRLPADTMRPFDGTLARYLERVAIKVANLKIKQLENFLAKNKFSDKDKIFIPILLEENRFKFQADLAEVKKSRFSKKYRDRYAKAEQKLLSKRERIIMASKGICPYTGNPIGKDGQIDHILPRSYSKSSFGTVFDSEVNLIYCSVTGNTKKGDKEYFLENLHSNYLKKVFGTAEVNSIRKTIENTLQNFKGQVYFNNLKEEEQRDFRHALFVRDLRHKVMELVVHEGKMRVSGTQGYLARHIYKNLKAWEKKSHLEGKINYFVENIPANNIFNRRTDLAQVFSELEKHTLDGQRQSAGSHVIDATLVWLDGLENEVIPNWPEGMVSTPEYTLELLPEEVNVISLEARAEFHRSRPAHVTLFKSGMFAERYLSLILGKEKGGFGFSLKEMVEIDDPKALEEAFTILKPVLLYRKKPVDQSLADYQKLVKGKNDYIYFTIDRKKAAEVQREIFHKENPTEKEIYLDNLLISLAYYGAKTNNSLDKVLADEKQNINLSHTKLPEKTTKKFVISLPSETKKPKKFSGTITLPYKETWEQVLQNKELKKLAKSYDNWKNVPERELKELHETLFPKTIENPLRHKAVRKVYTLPLLANPSNSIRIRRRSPFGEIYQVQDKDGNIAAGFALDNNQIDFNKPVLAPYLYTKNLVPLNRDLQKPHNQKFIFMDEWREIDLNSINNSAVSRLLIAPNSIPRAKVRIELYNEKLGVKEKDVKTFIYLAPIADALGEKDNQNSLWTKALKNVTKLLKEDLKLKPRDGKIKIFKASQKILGLEFFLDGTTKEVKDLLQTGKVVKNLV